MTKSFRQAQVLKLIRENRIHTQQELAAELDSRGFPTSQVTLSRDLRDLGILKTPDGYRERNHVQPVESNLARVLSEFLEDLRVAQNLVVLKTHPGGAAAVALAIDGEGFPELVGTVAGDDTIFAATSSETAAKKLRKKLTAMW
jgi:transcriptional regulator of arginine metabolism